MLKRKHRYEAEETISDAAIASAESWYLVRVRGDKVKDAAAILTALGCVVWAPLQRTFRKVGRGRFKAARVPVSYPAFFNYVFIAGRDGEPDWSALYRADLIRGLIVTGARQGCARAARLTAADVLNAKRRLASDKFDRRHEAARGAIRPGDRVMFKGAYDPDSEKLRNLWHGHQLRVVSLREGAGRLAGYLLGKDVIFEAPLDALVRSA